MKIRYCLLFAALITNTFAETDMHRLIWNDDPMSTMTVAWRQISDRATVYYDEVDHGNDIAKYTYRSGATKNNDHLELKTNFAELKGLKAGTKYYFLIADKNSASRRYYFKTAPKNGTDFSFIAGGDTKSDLAKYNPSKKGSSKAAYYYQGRKSNRMVAKLRPLFIIFVGDFTSNSSNPAYWVDWFNDWNTDTCSEDGRMYPLIPIHGNHENPNGLTDLKNLFGTPESVYYTIDFGKDFLRLFVLNTELYSKSSSKSWDEQTQWLEDMLSKSADFKYRAVTYHKPIRPHTKGKKNQEEAYRDWAPLFTQHKVNLSFDGDAHTHKITYPLVVDPDGEEGFRRDDVNGTMFIGEGSWGAGPRPANKIRDWTLSHAGISQFKWIHVKNNTFNIHTVNTENEDKVGSLNPDQQFKLPEGINLFDTPGIGTIIKYPFEQ
jgi:hypothetical protein